MNEPNTIKIPRNTHMNEAAAITVAYAQKQKTPYTSIQFWGNTFLIHQEDTEKEVLEMIQKALRKMMRKKSEEALRRIEEQHRERQNEVRRREYRMAANH